MKNEWQVMRSQDPEFRKYNCYLKGLNATAPAASGPRGKVKV